MTKYLGTIEIDQRQRFIHATDKLREMLGGSWRIGQTIPEASALRLQKKFQSIRIIMPVSGVIRLGSDDLQTLGSYMEELRARFHDQLGLPCSCAIIETQGDLDQSFTALEEAIRAVKDARGQEDGSPRIPQMVPCNLQPDQFANKWIPGRPSPAHRPRRLLASTGSYERESTARESLTRFLSQFPSFTAANTNPKRDINPYRLSDLRHGNEDQYLALIKADGDGMGRLLINLSWERLAAALSEAKCAQPDELHKRYGFPQSESWTAEAAVCAFSLTVEQCLKGALGEAVASVLAGQQFQKFPIAPVIAAGEDFWILCRRDLAFAMAENLSDAYSQRAEENQILKTALAVARKAAGEGAPLAHERLTLTVGVLFAKEGFPLSHQLELAEELLTTAKRRRKERSTDATGGRSTRITGYIDYLFLQSTAREEVSEIRQSGYEYQDDVIYRLYTRPLPVPQFTTLREIALQVWPCLPPSKWNQLRTILRLGRLSPAAFTDWRLHLSTRQEKALESAFRRWLTEVAGFPEPIESAVAQMPWFSGKNNGPRVTPFVEWIEIAEAMTTGGEGSSPLEPEDQAEDQEE